MALDLTVNLSPQEASNVINHAIVNGSITGKLIDDHTVSGQDGSLCVISVYEKHYYRAGNRLTLTVIIDNMSGCTHVHSISGGGGEGLFRFDWGASDSFENCVSNALSIYVI